MTVRALLQLLKQLANWVLSPQLQTEMNAQNNYSDVSDDGLVLLNLFLFHSLSLCLSSHSFTMVG